MDITTKTILCVLNISITALAVFVVIVMMKLTSECEQTLPRDQNCKLIAVPETEEVNK